MVEIRFYHRRTRAFFVSSQALEWLLIYFHFHSGCFFLSFCWFQIPPPLGSCGNWICIWQCAALQLMGSCFSFIFRGSVSSVPCTPQAPVVRFHFFFRFLMRLCCKWDAAIEKCVWVWVAVRMLFAVVVDVYTSLLPPRTPSTKRFWKDSLKPDAKRFTLRVCVNVNNWFDYFVCKMYHRTCRR